MLGIIEQIQQDTTALGPGQVCDLDFSWRSQQSVLSLVSSVFPRVFPQLPRERVVLTPAPEAVRRRQEAGREPGRLEAWIPQYQGRASQRGHARAVADGGVRSEEHTSELQSRGQLASRLLLEHDKDPAQASSFLLRR